LSGLTVSRLHSRLAPDERVSLARISDPPITRRWTSAVVNGSDGAEVEAHAALPQHTAGRHRSPRAVNQRVRRGGCVEKTGVDTQGRRVVDNKKQGRACRHRVPGKTASFGGVSRSLTSRPVVRMAIPRRDATTGILPASATGALTAYAAPPRPGTSSVDRT
jgi:hypothetical protein